FMGVSLAAEKEMIFIVTKKEQKNDIMKAIMEKAGTDSPAKAIVFSLPVTDTAGLRLIED
ncbi:MAG: P-II family nitrogen regulator, partial [Lachnospiraceae bacterium]|nr:P-II family nitrogen regulator [Lachnospiraceae bacterium]